MVLVVAASAQPNLPFSRAWSIPAQGSPVDIVLADLNADGIPDVANTTDGGNIQVRFGIGSGLYEEPQSYFIGGSTYSMAVADFDHASPSTPKLPDLLVTAQDGRAHVLLNDPTNPGTFPAELRRVLPGLSASSALTAIDDFDHDGNQDALVGYFSGSGGATISFGDGLGNFDTRTAIVDPGISGVGVACSGVGTNIRKFILLSNFSTGQLLIREAAGTRGSFLPLPTINLGGTGLAVPVSCDLNGDDHEDIVVTNYYSGRLFVLIGQGNGQFYLSQTLDVGSNWQASLPIATDFDRDGHVDIAVPTIPGSVQLYRGSANGLLTADATLSEGLGGGYARGVAGDINGDDYDDLLVTSPWNQISIFVNRKNLPPFQFSRAGSVPTLGSPVEIGVADLNGDGIQDLANTTHEGEIQVRFGIGNGQYGNPQTYVLGGSTFSLKIADFDHASPTSPKLPDLLVTAQDGRAHVLLNDPGQPGTFPVHLRRTLPGLASHSNVAIAADVDNDGNQDVLVGYWTGSGGATVSFGDGLGNFETHTVVIDPGLSGVGVATSHAGPNSRRFLLLSNFSTGQLLIKEAVGPRGSFQHRQTIPLSGNGLATPLACNLNGDSHDDIVIPQYYEGKLFVLLGQGDGQFQLSQTLSVGANWQSGQPTAADFDGDGHVDVAVMTYPGPAQLYRGSAEGVLIPDSLLSDGLGGGYARGIAADVNNDNLPDLLVTSPWSQITIFLNGENRPPVANAGPDQTLDAVAGTAVAILDGSASSDPEGQPLTYTWSGAFSEGGGQATGPNPSVTLSVGSHVLTLTVSDGRFSATDTVVIAVANRPPSADAGPDRIVDCNGMPDSSVTLDGSGTADPNGDALTYVWTGPFGTATGVSPSVALPLGTSVVTLTVSDGEFHSTDSVVITVKVAVDGFFGPMASLVPEGTPSVPLPPHAMKKGRTIPLKLRMSCGSMNLTDSHVGPPSIIGVWRNGDAVNLSVIDPDPGVVSDSGIAFRFADDHWRYNLGTSWASSGRYEIAIQMPDGLVYRGAFEIR